MDPFTPKPLAPETGQTTSMSNSKVDQFWQLLKSSTAPKPASANPTVAAPGALQKPIPSSHGVSKAQPQKQPVEAAVAPATAPAWQQTVDALTQHANKLTEGLKSETTSVRVKSCQGLKEVVSFLSTPGPAAISSWSESPAEVLSELLETSMGKMLLRRFDDASQACRETCVGVLLEAIKASPVSVLVLLPYAMPVIEERLGGAAAHSAGGAAHTNAQPVNLVEGSEEVRLLLSQLVLLLVQLGAKALSAYATEVVLFLEAMLRDPYHEINVIGCETTVELNVAMGLRLSSVSKQLVASTLPLTTHKRYKVRIAALRAVRATMHQAAHEMILEMIAWRDPNVVPIAAFYGDDLKVNFAGKLATDSQALVRLEWVLTLEDWMLNLRERIDHEPRLLPYLLSALTDESSAVMEAAVTALDRLGRAYEADHIKDLTEVTQYLPEEAHGLGWRGGLAGAMAGEGQQAELLNGVEGVTAGSGAKTQPGHSRRWPAGVILPSSLTRHYGLGAIRVVQGQAGRSIHPLIREMFAWQSDSRKSAAILLRTLLALAGDSLHQHVQLLVPALCRAMPDPEVRSLALDCMALLSCSLPPSLLLDLLLPRLADTRGDTPVYVGIINLMTAMLRGASGRSEVVPLLPSLLDVLDGDGGCMMTLDTSLRGAATEYMCEIMKGVTLSWGKYATRLLVASLHLTTNPNAMQPSSLVLPPTQTQGAAATTSTSSATASCSSPSADPNELLAVALNAEGGSAGLVACLLEDMLSGCHVDASPNPTLTAAVLAHMMWIVASRPATNTTVLPGSQHSGTGAEGDVRAHLHDVVSCMEAALPLLVQGVQPNSGELLLGCLEESLQMLLGIQQGGHGTGAGCETMVDSRRLSLAEVLQQLMERVSARGIELALRCTMLGMAGGWISAAREVLMNEGQSGKDAVAQPLAVVVCEKGMGCGRAPTRLVACLVMRDAISRVAGAPAGPEQTSTTVLLEQAAPLPPEVVQLVRGNHKVLDGVIQALLERLTDTAAPVRTVAVQALGEACVLVRRAGLDAEGAGEVLRLVQRRAQQVMVGEEDPGVKALMQQLAMSQILWHCPGPY